MTIYCVQTGAILLCRPDSILALSTSQTVTFVFTTYLRRKLFKSGLQCKGAGYLLSNIHKPGQLNPSPACFTPGRQIAPGRREDRRSTPRERGWRAVACRAGSAQIRMERKPFCGMTAPRPDTDSAHRRSRDNNSCCCCCPDTPAVPSVTVGCGALPIASPPMRLGMTAEGALKALVEL